MKKYFPLLFFLLFVLSLPAQISFNAFVQQPVVMDAPFQIQYTINAEGDEFRAPDFANFELLAGPFTYTSASIQALNGKQSSSMSVTYTFTLLPVKTGTFKIGPASIVVDGKKYSSNGLSINVLPATGKSAQRQQDGKKSNTQQAISGENLFIRPLLSKPQVFEQEAIMLTYKLYSAVDVLGAVPKKIPDFSGFMKQDVELPANRQFDYESINGKNYLVVPLYQVMLFPQKSGALHVDPMPFEVTIQMQNPSSGRSIFDDFFDSYSNVNKIVTAPSVTINATELPQGKPANFSGAVGQFSLKSSITSENVKANEAVTIKIVITGAGNMKMLNIPEIKFPESFEVYDPKVTNDFKVATAGISGSKSIEYLFIPRSQGEYEIPATQFSYFDTHAGMYKTLTVPASKVKVAKGDASAAVVAGGSFVNKENVKQLGNDIRYIQTDNFSIMPEQKPLFGSITALLLYIVPLFLGIILFLFFRKKAKENADIKLIQNKRANKVAVKRLKQAKQLLSEGKKDQFYEEVLKSTWNYVGNKFGIAPADLTKEHISEKLTAKFVDNKLIEKLNNTLNTCEFARYASTTGQAEMGNLYAETIDLISQLEEKVRN